MLSNHELKQRLSYLILGQRGGQSRVSIIEALKDRPYNINQLAAMLDLNYRTVKHHVDMLLKHGLIGTSRTGGYGEVYFISPELEARFPMFQEISQKLKTVTTSPKFFQNVIEQTNDAVVVVDEKLEVLYWNRSAEGLYGYRCDEVAGTRIAIFPDAEMLRGVQRMISEGKKVVGLETQARTKAGALLDVAITIDGIKDEGDRPVGYSLISTDITERRRALEALLVSQQRYILAQQAARIISWEWDPVTDVMKWSDRLGPFLGMGQSFRADTLRSFLKCVPAQDREMVSKAAAAAVRRGREISFEHRVRCPNGTIRWVRHTGGVLRDADGKALRLLGILQDFTDRRDAERRYERILETSLDGFWINDMKGRFLEANDACCRMLGYGRREILGMSIRDIEADEKPAETLRHIQKVMKGGADRFETRHRRKDGRLIDVEVSATFLDSEGGRLVTFVRDITERKRAEEQIRHMASFPLLNPNPILELDLAGKVMYSNASADRIVREAGLKAAAGLLPRDMPAVLADLARHPGSTVYRDVPAGDSVFHLSIFRPRGLEVLRVYSIDITGLVRAEDELHRTEERFRAVATLTPDHILMQDAELRYQFVVNPQLGLSEKDMLGKRDEDFLSKEDADRLTEIKRKVLRTGKPEHVSLPLTTPSGEKQFFEGSYIPKLGADGRVDGVIGYFRNVTERVRIEEALAESEQKYRLLFKRMHVGFALHDIITDQSGKPVDYRFLELNPAFEQLTGLKASEVVGRTVKEVLPDTDPFWIETCGKVAISGRSVHFERYFPPLDRTFDVVAYRPSEGRFAAIFTDISERKRVEAALGDGEGRFRRLFESIDRGVVYQDEAGRITHANPAAERILGLSLAQMQGRTSMHPDWRAIHEDGSPVPGEEHPSMVALRTGKARKGFVMGVFNPEKNDYTWISMSAVPQFRPGGAAPYEVFTTFEEISGPGKSGAPPSRPGGPGP